MSTENTSDVFILNDYPRTQATDFWELSPRSASEYNCNASHLYVSSDPRTRDFYNNTFIPYDRPPYQTTIDGLNFNDVYRNPSLDKSYFYDSYANVDIGDITYYVDPTNKTPYLPEVYTIPSQVVPIAYQDPISRVKWEYVKLPTKCPISPYQETHDIINHREDMMSLKSIKLNRPLYSLVV